MEHKCIWQGSKLVSEYYDGKELEFFYDESGSPYAFSYKADSTASPVIYYYLTNLQGDVTAILDADGNIVAGYTYDAWGKPLSSTGDLAEVNPLRYRGYYYDSETGLYYVSSRYYDPEICRWINADDASYLGANGDFISYNLFAYCLNNPVNRIDDGGKLSITIASAIVGFVVGGVSQIVTNVMQGEKWDNGVLGAAAGGMAYNVASIYWGPTAAGYIAAAAEATTNEVLSYISGKKEVNSENIASSVLTVAGKTVVNGSLYAVSGKAVNKIIPFDAKKATYGVGSLIHGRIIHKVWAQSAVQATMVLGEKIAWDAMLSPSVSKYMVA